MRGHVTLRGKVWYVVAEGQRDPLNPTKRNQQWIRTDAATKKEAEKERTRILRDLDTGIALASPKQTLAEYAERWLASRAKIAPNTRNRYRRNLDRHILPHLGNLMVGSIAPVHLREWLVRLRAGGSLSETTIANIFATLSICLGSAVRLEVIRRNPALAVERPVPDSPERVIWQFAQARRFIERIRGDRDEAYYLTAIATGLRKGELHALRWSDVDLANGVLHVRRGMIAVPNEPVRFTEPKHKSQRRIALPSRLIEVLGAHRARHEARRAECGEAWVECDLVFCRPNGEYLPFTTMSHRWEALRERLAEEGLPSVAFHDLRHLHASLGIVLNIDPKTLSLRMGHHSSSFTMDRYGHALSASEVLAASAYDTLLAVEGEDALLAKG